MQRGCVCASASLSTSAAAASGLDSKSIQRCETKSWDYPIGGIVEHGFKFESVLAGQPTPPIVLLEHMFQSRALPD